MSDRIVWTGEETDAEFAAKALAEWGDGLDGNDAWEWAANTGVSACERLAVAARRTVEPTDATLRAYQRDRDAAIDALEALRVACCERDLARLSIEAYPPRPAAGSRLAIAEAAYETLLARGRP